MCKYSGGPTSFSIYCSVGTNTIEQLETLKQIHSKCTITYNYNGNGGRQHGKEN